MHRQEPQSIVTKWQRVIASLVLLALLVQILLFFVGLMVPVRRAASLWGKNLEDRREVVWPPGRALKAFADKLPTDTRIYLLYPQPPLHYSIVYYFYPRTVSVTMTNARYGSLEECANWNEVPSWQWLETNKYSYVLSFKNGGGRVWRVVPGLDLNADAK
jgi:hypothetical protein